jgi:hypothetical protein
VIATQRRYPLQLIKQGQPSLWSVRHAERNRAVHLHHRRAGEPSQLLVQIGYACPIGGLRCLSSGVAGRDPSLEGVRAQLGRTRFRPFQSG